MNLHKKLDKILFESVIDYKRKELSSAIWNKIADSGRVVDDYQLKPSIRSKIINKVNRFNLDANKTIIIGSITSFYYNDETDIDVHIFLRNKPTDVDIERIKKRIDSVEEEFIGSHPIQYYVHPELWDTNKLSNAADSMYDLTSDRWLYWRPLQKAVLRDYYQDFQALVKRIDLDKEELRRDFIDYDLMMASIEKVEDAEEVEIEAQQKLNEIEQEIRGIIDAWEVAKDNRTSALQTQFDEELESGTLDIERYRSNSLLPDNVIYKLLERYHYKKFVRALKQAMKDNNLSKTEVSDAKKAFGELSP